MKTKTKLTSLAFGLMLAASSTSFAALTVNKVTVDSTKVTNGYMNVFNLPSAGGGYQFGSAWAIADLNAVFSDQARSRSRPTASTIRTATGTPRAVDRAPRATRSWRPTCMRSRLMAR